MLKRHVSAAGLSETDLMLTVACTTDEAGRGMTWPSTEPLILCLRYDEWRNASVHLKIKSTLLIKRERLFLSSVRFKIMALL